MDRACLRSAYDYLAPDGSEVRLRVQGRNGGLAHFRLPPGRISAAKQHRSVEELWFFIGGRGEMVIGDIVTVVCAGVSLRVPPATRFQFRSDGDEALVAVAVTMPPWPGEEEAVDALPFWPEAS